MAGPAEPAFGVLHDQMAPRCVPQIMAGIAGHLPVLQFYPFRFYSRARRKLRFFALRRVKLHQGMASGKITAHFAK